MSVSKILKSGKFRFVCIYTVFVLLFSGAAFAAQNVIRNAEGPQFVIGWNPDGTVGCVPMSLEEVHERLGALPAAVGGDALRRAAGSVERIEDANATITVNFREDPEPGLQGTPLPWPAPARNAFLFAASIWAGLLNTPVEIVIDAFWVPIPGTTLGLGGPRLIAGPGFLPRQDRWYPRTLADFFSGSDLHPGENDIRVQMNSNETDWYFDTDGNPPGGRLDFVSVVLHELTHGFGFSDTFCVGSSCDPATAADQGQWGLGDPPPLATVFDDFVQDTNGVGLLDEDEDVYPNPSTALKDALEGNVFWGGSEAVAAHGSPPPLFAPNVFQSGSSISHWDEGRFPSSSGNALMTPSLSTGEANHDPGPLTLGVLRDMGYEAQSGPGLLLFTQFANGQFQGPNSTRVILRYNGSGTAAGRLVFKNATGNPVSLPVVGVGSVTEVPFSLDAFNTVEFETDGSGALQTGVIEVQVESGDTSKLEGTLIFSLLGNFVSIDSTPIRNTHQVYTARNAVENTGVAIYNPSSDATATLEITLVDNAGVLRAGPKNVQLGPMNQLVAFVDQPQFFQPFFQQTGTLFGTLNIQVTQGPAVAVVGLIQKNANGALIAVSTSANIVTAN